MKTELTKFIKKNYKTLSEAETEKLVNQLCGLLPRQTIKLSELETGSNFKYKGWEFIKLADEKESCYCLMNDTLFESEFGKINDWAKSPIRERLNEFDENGNSKAIKGISKEDLVEVSLNYYAYKVPNGKIDDRITLLSWEEVYTYNFSCIDRSFWLRSGNYSNAAYAYLLDSSGGNYGSTVSNSYAVRPALHFRRDIEVEI